MQLERRKNLVAALKIPHRPLPFRGAQQHSLPLLQDRERKSRLRLARIGSTLRRLNSTLPLYAKGTPLWLQEPIWTLLCRSTML